MTRYTIPLFLAISAALMSCAAAGQTAKKMAAEVSGQQLGYWLHLPEGDAPAGGWPLVLFLHGAGERGLELEKVKVHGPPKLIDKVDQLKGAVVVSPQCPTNGWWKPEVLKVLLGEVLDAQAGKIDSRRLYCTGLSMGGYGTWSLVANYPRFFAAAAPICGGGDIRRLPGRVKYEGAPLFDIDELKRAKALPVWAFHGAADGVVPPAECEMLVDALKAAGNASVKFSVYPGVGHDSWTRTYDDPAFWAWMFAQKRPAGGKVKVFLLAGQSNMEGQAVVDLDHEKYYNGGKGILTRVMAEAGDDAPRYAHLKNGAGEWSVRDDVFVRARIRDGKILLRGGLSIGYTGYGDPHHFGPELQIGHRLGDRFEEPVLLVKTAWGGKSLHKDFRPPSSGGETGEYYQRMLAEYREALDKMSTDFPELAGLEPELAGLVWFQGWNDMFDADALAGYEANLKNLIRDLRAEFGVPSLPVVVGELGNLGEAAGANMKRLRAAQEAACADPAWGGTVRFVKTAAFARPAEESPNVGHGHHWFGNAESYFLIGDALGAAMADLQK